MVHHSSIEWRPTRSEKGPYRYVLSRIKQALRLVKRVSNDKRDFPGEPLDVPIMPILAGMSTPFVAKSAYLVVDVYLAVLSLGVDPVALASTQSAHCVSMALL